MNDIFGEYYCFRDIFQCDTCIGDLVKTQNQQLDKLSSIQGPSENYTCYKFDRSRRSKKNR